MAMGASSGQADTHDRRITGRHVLLGMLAFFGVVFAANGVMMWMAARSFDGVDEPDAYRRGVHYNERLAAARAQRALGWRVRVDLPAVAGDGARRRVVVTVQDRQRQPLAGLAVRVTMRSPVNAHEDRMVALAPDPAHPGQYGGTITLPRLGKWQAIVAIHDQADHRWRGVFDLFLAPPAAAQAGAGS